MTTDDALALYAKTETTQAELARMVLAGHALAAEVRRLRKTIERLEAELSLLYPREADHE